MENLKRYIFIFNPEADYALADFNKAYTPPASVVELRRNLALQQLKYAGPNDFILLLDVPDESNLKKLDKRCILPADFKTFFDSIRHETDKYLIQPWNWTPDLAHKLRLNCAPEELLPSDDRLKLIRRLSDRITTIEFNRHLNQALTARGLSLHISPIPKSFDNIDEAIEWQKFKGKVFFKYPWSSSGRGVLLADENLSEEKLRQWIAGGIRRQEHIIGEEFFGNKRLDCASEWHISDGKPHFLGISLFYATEDGRYLGNESKSQETLRKLIHIPVRDFGYELIQAQKEALEIIAKDYSGYVGIDMMANKEGQIRAGVELNFRMTMGIANLMKNMPSGPQPKILIIGKGNVGSHLANALFLEGTNVDLQSSRDINCNLSDYSDILIAVKDDAIAEVARKVAEKIKMEVPGKKPIVAHTSGSVPLDRLTEIFSTYNTTVSCGVFYPMQTFTRGVRMEYSSIPFLIEGSDCRATESLKSIASLISSTVIDADSKVRAAYHIGAVLTCNFTNHLCALASDFLETQGLDFTILLPLLHQTINKLHSVSPSAAQTGPAIRGDYKVIDYHLESLKNYSHIAEIYSTLSSSIINSKP